VWPNVGAALKHGLARGDGPPMRGEARRSRPSGAALVRPWAVAAVLGPATAAAAPAGPTLERRTAATTGHPSTESSQVLPKWTPSAGVAIGVEHAFDANGGPLGRSRADVVARTRADLLFAFGLFDWTELSLDLPLVLRQRVRAPGATTTATGLGDLRIGLKGTLLRTPLRGVGLGLMLDVTAPTGSATAFTGAGAPTWAPRLLFEHRGAWGIVSAIDVGYFARNDGRIHGWIVGDAVTWRAALRVPFPPKGNVALVTEAGGSIALVRGARHGVDLRIGLRGQARSGLVVGAYVGGSPVATFGSTQLGGLLSFGWAPPTRTKTTRAFDGSPRPAATALAIRHDALVQSHAKPTPKRVDPRDPDRDGVLAAADRCPRVAEDRDTFEDDDGCPELDDDHDAIADAFDLCPRSPELVNGVLDVDGCPDRRLADGTVVTSSVLDPATLVPELAFAGPGAELTAKSAAELDALVELVRLNPWIERIELAVYVHPSADAKFDRRRAEARAQAVVARFTAADVPAWRVRVQELAAVPDGVAERVRVAVKSGAEGLRPLAPAPVVLERFIADAATISGIETAAQGPATTAGTPSSPDGARSSPRPAPAP